MSACTDLVHWTEALHRFSSRDAIIVVGSVLEKHFDGDFTPDQEKEITFKRFSTGIPRLKTWLGTQWVKSCPIFFTAQPLFKRNSSQDLCTVEQFRRTLFNLTTCMVFLFSKKNETLLSADG